MAAVRRGAFRLEGATEEAGPNDQIRRFERVAYADAGIRVTIVPSAMRPLLWARIIADDLANEEVDDRPLTITIADNIEDSVSSRVNLARLRGDFVWIVGELDAEERTLEMRGGEMASGSALSVDDALDLIEDSVGDVFYRGQWFFTFNGGCITFDFDAEDRVAQTIAEDAAAAIGFYPAYELREIAEDMGFDIVP